MIQEFAGFKGAGPKGWSVVDQAGVIRGAVPELYVVEPDFNRDSNRNGFIVLAGWFEPPLLNGVDGALIDIFVDRFYDVDIDRKPFRTDYEAYQYYPADSEAFLSGIGLRADLMNDARRRDSLPEIIHRFAGGSSP